MFGETRKQAQGLGDLLLWFGLVDDGIVLQRDGSLLATWEYRGPDLLAATHAEMAAVAKRLNRIFRLGSGWMIQVDAFRSFSSGYAPAGAFPDHVTALIDRERREQFAQEGAHFENEYFLTLSYMPPVAAVEKIRGFMVSGGPDGDERDRAGSRAGDEAIRFFKAKTGQFEDVFASQFPVNRLKTKTTPFGDGYERVDDELLTFLRRCVTGVKAPVLQPEIPVFLNDLLAMEDFRGGMETMMGDRHLRTLSIDGFPRSTYPGALSIIDTVGCEYRWNTRAILMDPAEAQGLIGKIGRKWQFQQRGLKDQIFKSKGGGQVNQFAMTMAADSDGALAEATSGEVQFCYFSSSIVLQQKDKRLLENQIGEFRKVLVNRGFGVRVEDINAVDAFLGTLPGNGVAQVRRVIAHTRNYVDLMPISAVYAGEKVNPSPLMPPNSPPLLFAATQGGTPYRFNLHDNDVAHTLIVGPTGAGKSVQLALTVAQWFRYPKARVFAFDKGHSLFALCTAAGGRFYDIGEGGLSFQPLRDIDDDAEFGWGQEWVETVLRMQGLEVGPRERNLVHSALRQLATAPRERRTLTELEANLQDADLKAAIEPYVIDGALGGMLDSKNDGLRDSRFVVCEMETLLSGSYGEATVMAVLLYLFRRMERMLDGSPTLVPIDEAWLFLKHPAWRDKIQDWLKTLRKKNAAVVLATQSISDVKDSPIAATILQSTATKIYLPNSEAGNEGMRQFYEFAGLNSREIELLQGATPKRDYYVVQRLGRRMISFRLGPVALAFLGVSGQRDRKRIEELVAEHGSDWVRVWMLERRVSKGWVDYYKGEVTYELQMAV
ncbi:Conjugative transfer protein TrbE (plasmid) [Acidisarcina polymorpha]|uniref:Conjugative transfer protein TrbE n=1 Tax=Acidisarcina polymorpha TaxID=2211140 RepID=A0A2Z5GBZ2_9BACT|nr:conjugal transfer protein TrbE [Acidisarcina polymorpha]AXC16440.1 Conjugative transfer protein TrbE [Acidisarcina polymorpha]